MRSGQILKSQRETGSVLVIALLIMVLLSFLGVTLLTVASTEHTIASNSQWSEGALMAADAGVNKGINQLSANAQTSVAQINTTTIGSGYTYRSGRRTGSAAPLTFVGTRTEAGYSLAVGTGYNPSGYAFHTYQINAVGTGGPSQTAAREVEVQAEYGPIAQ
jgi:Tfp pilus assembly protein PilX